MAFIFNQKELAFEANKQAPEQFQLKTSIPRLSKATDSKHLVFDFRQLEPGKYSFPYHFHRNAEEIIFILSGSMTLRSKDGFREVKQGDLIFFEIGETGAHQFYNHTDADCSYFDLRTSVGIDVCEYPDSGKINILPFFENFFKDNQIGYFDGEEDIDSKWKSQQL